MLIMIKPTLERIHEWNHSNMFDALPEEIEDDAKTVVKLLTDIDIDSMHFTYKDALHSIAKNTYVQVANKSLMLSSFDTWALLLMYAIDQIASEEKNKEISRKSLSGIQRILREHPERVDANIRVWFLDMFKNVYIF